VFIEICQVLRRRSRSTSSPQSSRIAHGSDVTPEAVEVQPQLSSVEGANGIPDSVVWRLCGVGLIHAIQDVARALGWLAETQRQAS